MGIMLDNLNLGGGTSSNTSRNIGDIFYTTRTDNSLNGAVECNGSQYNFSDFDSNLQNLLDEGKIPYVSIGEFDSMVSEKGWCDSFGYGEGQTLYALAHEDSPDYVAYYTNITDLYNMEQLNEAKVYDLQGNLLEGWYLKREGTVDCVVYDNNNEAQGSWFGLLTDITIKSNEADTPTTYFKVPKLSAYIIQKENIPVVGNGMTLGLTNGEKFAGLIVNGPDALQVNETSYGTSIGSPAGPSSGFINGNRVTVTSDPTKSGMIADLSNDSFTGRVMIQLFNSTTDIAVATCNQVLADVSALNQGDYVIYYDSADITDHSHALPNANTLTNHQWYRIYKSGWIEQGGIFTNSIDETIILPVTMSSALYNITTEIYNGQIGWESLNWSVSDITPTQFHVFYDGADNDPQGFSWEVKGFMLDYSISSTI